MEKKLGEQIVVFGLWRVSITGVWGFAQIIGGPWPPATPIAPQLFPLAVGYSW